MHATTHPRWWRTRPIRGLTSLGRLPVRVRNHEMSRLAPVLAHAVGDAVTKHVVQGTRGNYNSATNNYLNFCTLYRVPSPFPVDELWFCAWLVRIATTVQVPSFRVYTAAIQYSHVNAGFKWVLRGSEMVRRTLRYLKRKYPVEDTAIKTPISLGLLKEILPLLPGWPVLAAMSHEDRMFAAASVIAVSAFLRGGEFLTYPGSSRKVFNIRTLSKARLSLDVPCWCECHSRSAMRTLRA